MGENIVKSREIIAGNLDHSKLYFTGNWFIDCGILGFVNIMEEFYEWDVDKLNEKIDENHKLVYFGYFPLAFIYNNISG
jgi:hypothetical protein